MALEEEEEQEEEKEEEKAREVRNDKPVNEFTQIGCKDNITRQTDSRLRSGKTNYRRRRTGFYCISKRTKWAGKPLHPRTWRRIIQNFYINRELRRNERKKIILNFR